MEYIPEALAELNEWKPTGSSPFSAETQFSKPGLGSWYWPYAMKGRAAEKSNSKMRMFSFFIVLR